MVIIYQVPSKDIRRAYEKLLAPVQADYELQVRETEAHRQELNEFGLPALRAKFEELLEDWETLPKKVQKRTKAPIINENFEYILTYEEMTFSNWWKNVLKWGFGGMVRWYELEYITIKDIYQFKNPNHGISCATDNRRLKLRKIISQYADDFIAELDIHELRNLGLDPTKYQKIQRS